jgi:hypothetical protein
LCNEQAITKESYYYQIDIYHGCYYRSQNPFTLLEDGQVSEHITDPKDEVFAFSRRIQDKNKAYILHLDYQDDKTTLFRYDVSKEEEMAHGDPKDTWTPENLEQQDLPLLDIRPDFSVSNREDLLDRLDGWLFLS